MKIAFLGDIHGRVFHALAVLAKWQKVYNEKLDLVIQAGDFGAYPYPDEHLLNNRFVKKDPTELDFSRYIKGDGDTSDFFNMIKTQLKTPIYFIRGNHEDFDWLDSLNDKDGICSVGEDGLLRYIKDGTVHKFGDMNIAFLGGADFGAKHEGFIDLKALERLMNTKYKINILVTHEIYHGIGFSYHGLTQGSRNITMLVEKIKPEYHITAHYHHMMEPHQKHGTVHLGLNNLVSPLRGKPGRNLKPGWMAVLDTENKNLEFVRDDWLLAMHTHMTIDDLREEIES